MSEISYTIKKGDSLSVIAKRNKTTVENLKKRNKIKDANSIWPGQKLSIPKQENRDAASVKTSAQKNTNKASIFHNALVKAIDEQKIPSLEEMDYPNINALGLKLSRENNTIKKPEANKSSLFHVIQNGDTLSKVAKANGVSVDEIKNLNPNVNERALKIGSKLILPLKNAKAMSKPFGSNIKSQTSEVIGPYSDWTPPKERRALSIAQGHAKRMENFVPQAEICPAGYYTYGYGHRIGVKKGDTISKAQAEKLLKKDLKEAYNGIEKALGEEAYDKLNEKQMAALTNMAFNGGIKAVVESDFFALIKKGKYEDAQAKMDAVFANKTDKKGKIVRGADGRPVKQIKMGLLIRRAKEMLMFGEGKLSPKAEKRVLELLNKGLNTNFKSLDDSDKMLRNRLNALEQKNAKNKAGMTPAEKSRLRQLRNVRELLDVLKFPEDYVASLDKHLPPIASC